MAKKTVASANQMVADWMKAMQDPSTAQSYTAGVNKAVQDGVNPMQLASTPEAMQSYVNNTARSVTNGKRAAGLANATVQDWQTNSTQVGAARLASGAQKAKKKYTAFAQKWNPIYQQSSDAANALPKGGYANAVQRAAAAIQVLMNAAGTA